MKKDRSQILFIVLVALVMILGSVVLYTFVIKPVITGYAVETRNQGVEYALVSIVQAAANCQQIPFNMGNQTVTLVALECFQREIPLIG
jgi:hypothetical protein